MFNLNIKPSTLALVTSSALALISSPAFAFTFHVDAATNNKDLHDWIDNVHIPAGNTFDVLLGTDTPIDPSVSSIDFTLTYNPIVVTTEGFTVNSATTLANFLDTPGSATGAVDNTLTFTLRINPNDSWQNILSDVVDLTFRGITRDDSATADIALLAVSGKDAFNNPITIPFMDPASDQRIFITPNATPEPASLALLSLTAVPLLLKKRRN